MKNIAFHCSENLNQPFIALLHTAEAPMPTEWRDYVAALEAVMSRRTGALVHVFVATDGGGPDAGQRAELAKVVSSGVGQALTHVFTDDVVVRGIVTAFRWLVRAHAIAHLPKDFADVCREYGFVPATILEAFAQAQSEFPPVQILETFKRNLPGSSVS